MFYLYIKTHNVTGLQYLGKTTKNPYQYKGSGVRWLNHLKKHGSDISTEILGEYDTSEELIEAGLFFSDKFDVVKNRNFANMKKENGDGGDMSMVDHWKRNRTSPEFKRKQAEGAKGNTNVRGYKWWKNSITGELKRAEASPGDAWVRGFGDHLTKQGKENISQAAKNRVVTEEYRNKMSEAAKKRKPNAKGTVWVVDKNGNRKRVQPDNIPEGYNRVKAKTN